MPVEAPTSTPPGTGERDDPRVVAALRRAREGVATPYGWAPLWAMVLVTLVDRIETSVVAGVLPLLQDEWGFSDAAGGAIPAAVGVAGILVTLPAGLIADRVDRRRFIAAVVAVWSLVITGSALATGFGIFFATRVALGFADSLDGASTASLLSDWYPPKARARVYGYQRMATFAGAPIGALLGGVVGELLGWRAVFFLMVVPGLAVAWFVRRQPEPGRGEIDGEVATRETGGARAGGSGAARSGAAPPDVGPSGATSPPPGASPAPDASPGPDAARSGADLASATAGTGTLAVGDAATGLRAQIRRLMGIPTVSRLYVGLLVLFLGLGGVAFWLPSLFERSYDIGEGAAAALAAGVGLVGIGVGATVGGILGDRMHGHVPGARVAIGGTGQLLGSLVGVVAFLVEAPGARVPLLTVTVVLLSFGVPNISAAVADVLPSRRRGVGFALMNFMVALGGAFGPFLVGALSDALGSLAHALAVLAAPMVLGSLIVLRARTSYEDDARAVLDEARGFAR